MPRDLADMPERLPADAPIVVLTGAGVSAESGIPTFRGATDGLWEGHSLEDVATPAAFAADPARVHAFYNARRRRLLDPAVRPNTAHAALAALTVGRPGPVLLVTQNVDDLHERAGSRGVVHMHGELARARCVACGDAGPCGGDLACTSACAACGSIGTVRPDVVWFGEVPLHLDRIYRALETCALFVAIGTSGEVYPAAGFVEVARAAKAATLELNLEASAASGMFEVRRRGPATALVPAFVNEVLRAR